MSIQKTIAYYNQLGSRIGYKLVAGGHRHFGYYKDKNYWYLPHAATAMIDHLADFAQIKPGERVLDAGCGEGRASLRIAQTRGARVSGIDVVPRSIAFATKRARKVDLPLDYRLGDYNHLPFADATFDVVFTLETFTHTADPRATINEFWRVLKPGGRIVIFDYSIQPLQTLPPDVKSAVQNIATYTDCPGFVTITHDYYDTHLAQWGFKNFVVVNETAAVTKSLRQIYVLSWLPYYILKLLKKVDHHPNTLISHFAKEGARKDYFRYITVKITKPKTQK